MEVNWTVLIGDLLTQVLRLMLPVCIGLVLKWAGDLWLRIKEARPDLAYAISKGAEIGYYAAEEYFHNHPAETGKMDYAIESAHEYIKEAFGIDIDLKVIRDAIADYGIYRCEFSWCKEQNASAE